MKKLLLPIYPVFKSEGSLTGEVKVKQLMCCVISLEETRTEGKPAVRSGVL